MNPPHDAAPAFGQKAFTCPHCSVVATHRFDRCGTVDPKTLRGVIDEDLGRSTCHNCDAHTYWVDQQVVSPVVLLGDDPNDFFPDNLRPLYDEARAIALRSPCGAAALLRLLVEQLCNHLGATGKDLYAKLADLRSKELLAGSIVNMADAVRITGASGVHDGYLDPDGQDDHLTVEALFMLVNSIVEEAYARPAIVEQLHHGKPMRG